MNFESKLRKPTSSRIAPPNLKQNYQSGSTLQDTKLSQQADYSTSTQNTETSGLSDPINKTEVGSPLADLYISLPSFSSIKQPLSGQNKTNSRSGIQPSSKNNALPNLSDLNFKQKNVYNNDQTSVKASTYLQNLKKTSTGQTEQIMSSEKNPRGVGKQHTNSKIPLTPLNPPGYASRSKIPTIIPRSTYVPTKNKIPTTNLNNNQLNSMHTKDVSAYNQKGLRQSKIGSNLISTPSNKTAEPKYPINTSIRNGSLNSTTKSPRKTITSNRTSISSSRQNNNSQPISKSTSSSLTTSNNTVRSSTDISSKVHSSTKPWHKSPNIKSQVEYLPETNQAYSEQTLKLARKTGKLNLSNKSLIEIPEDIYNLYEMGKSSIDMEITESQEKWWEYEDLTRLNLADNLITIIKPKISTFSSLRFLDLRNNKLEQLPQSFSELSELQFLSLAGNNFKELPVCLLLLHNISELQLQRNYIESIPDNLESLNYSLCILDISNNLLSGECKFLSNLCKLQKLFLTDNKLERLSDTSSWARNLKELAVSNNKLECVFELNSIEEIDCFNSLNFVDASKNRILRFFNIKNNDKQLDENSNSNNVNNMSAKPNIIINLPNLESLILDENLLDDEFLLNFSQNIVPKLSSLNISYNKITNLSIDFIMNCNGINRLNISNNLVKTIPPEICLMKKLLVFEFVGNPLRSKPRGQNVAEILVNFQNLMIEAKNTFSNQRSFGDFHQDMNSSENQNPHFDLTTRISTFLKNGFLDLSNFKKKFEDENITIEILTDEIKKVLQVDHTWRIKRLSLDSNGLDKIPTELLELVSNDLQVLSLSKNFIKSLDNCYFISENSNRQSVYFPNLKELYLSSNQIQSFGALVSSKHQYSKTSDIKIQFFAPNLEILDLSFNMICSLNDFGNIIDESELTQKLFSLSFGFKHLFGLESLHTLSLSQNKLNQIHEPFIFCGLQTVDLSNNSISTIPPELGLVSSIKSLNLVGNTFKIPRRQTLEKGTEAVMSWLKDRISED
ncbi:hypothetical protein BB561_004629 [Smittium simulii]|uniref:L domain-like protein n=1 Tax=Smittium simulii TaxID=133385 RepID=A0A2T9YF51_9FUNG|nr:hypothetical protein BB561_004629 [Smittium simulii]